MRKVFTFFCFIVFTVINSKAQTVIINTGTAGTPAYNAGPIYRLQLPVPMMPAGIHIYIPLVS